MKQGGLFLVVAGLALAGCAPPLSGQAYSESGAMQANAVRIGRVIAVRPVMIREDRNNSANDAIIGGAGGAGLGAIAGNGRGALIGGLIGALGGAVIGANSETRGELVTIQYTHSQRVIAIAQPMGPYEAPFYVGERVEVLFGRRDRVLPLGQP